ncbi:MAG: hypothetical protein HC884_12355 [Chloroflexaceae bacterium]|nr:hypothetical protein [Chloroflexaceae bacterium]
MLNEQDLRQVRDYIIEILPELLRADPKIATTIEGILAEHFPRRDEFARMLETFSQLSDEVKQLRETLQGYVEQNAQQMAEMRREAQERADEHARRMEEIRREAQERADRHEQQMTEMRQEMDQRFAEHAQRMEEIRRESQERADEHARRMEEIRREAQERADRHEQQMAEVRREMNERFEQVDQRFKQVDQRFEQIDQRFEQVDQRFEQVDQRFETTERTLLDIRRSIHQIQSIQADMLRRMDLRDAWFQVTVGDMGNAKGRNLEDTFALALRYGLQNPDIMPESIRLRQKLVDREGYAFKRGFSTEIDLIAEDGFLSVFEVKATADADDVNLFALKVELVAAQNPNQQVRGILISLGASDEVRQQCNEHGVLLLN